MSAQIPVVTAEEMARVEQWAVENGADLEAFMAAAGAHVARAARDVVGPIPKRIALLVGKGNKGGDSFAAGLELLKAGYSVEALCAVPLAQCSALSRRFGKRFEQSGGLFRPLAKEWGEYDLFIDGLLGTGFRGSPDAVMEEAIMRANATRKSIVAIDLPSGLNGASGVASPHTIQATQTITLGLPKIGLFLQDGWNYVGKLRIENIGLSESAMREAKPVAYVPNPSALELPTIVRKRHKYQRGFVVGFGGSEALKGAPKLSALAALHAGSGIVKLFSLEEIGPVADELICQRFEEKAWNAALAKAQAAFIGPGLGRSALAEQWCQKHIATIQQPCVIDADALHFLGKMPAHALLTPHRGEMSHLLGMKQPDADDATFLRRCQEFVNSRKVVLILKGAPTWILAAGKLPTVVPHGDPGMATAGAGDVLTGIVAALLAQGKECFDAAVLGVVLHGLAGEAAAAAKTSYGYTANDLIASLPLAFKALQRRL